MTDRSKKLDFFSYVFYVLLLYEGKPALTYENFHKLKHASLADFCDHIISKKFETNGVVIVGYYKLDRTILIKCALEQYRPVKFDLKRTFSRSFCWHI